jgi:hypothetical protein
MLPRVVEANQDALNVEKHTITETATLKFFTAVTVGSSIWQTPKVAI